MKYSLNRLVEALSDHPYLPSAEWLVSPTISSLDTEYGNRKGYKKSFYGGLLSSGVIIYIPVSGGFHVAESFSKNSGSFIQQIDTFKGEINTIQRKPHHSIGRMSPSYVEYDNTRKPKTMSWHTLGSKGRPADLPSEIDFDTSGKPIRFVWFINGRQDRYGDKPDLIELTPSGFIRLSKNGIVKSQSGHDKMSMFSNDPYLAKLPQLMGAKGFE